MLLFQKIITGQRRAGTQSIAIDHGIMHLVYPQILYNHGFQFLMGITVVPREIEGHGYSLFFFTRCIYDLGENGDCEGIRIP